MKYGYSVQYTHDTVYMVSGLIESAASVCFMNHDFIHFTYITIAWERFCWMLLILASEVYLFHVSFIYCLVTSHMMAWQSNIKEGSTYLFLHSFGSDWLETQQPKAFYNKRKKDVEQ